MAYPIYNIRKKITLPDFWDFASLPDENTPNLKELEYHDFPYSTQLCVPGCFDAAPDFAGKRGIGVYRTLIQVSTAKRLFLKLPGVFLSAKIFFDGKEAGLADLPYSGMTFEFSSEKNGTHELVIAVDNRADFSVCPLYSNYYDFYPFGGIIRKPEMYELPETCFDRCRVTTLQLNPPKVRLEFNLTGKEVKEFRGAVQFDDGNASPLVLESAGYNTFRTDFELDNFGLWSPEHPELHTVTLTTADDSITERFGIRMIGTENGRILLNGVPQILLGYNRHESHPEFGSAVPAQIMLEDLQILKRLNCNFVRGCHYPQNPDFLDLCDSMGIFVWEEALGWGDGEDHLTNSFFCEKQIEQTKLMLKNSMNHPSVILWGFLNENHSHLTCARNLIQKLVSLIRQTDPSRLVTYASCMAEQDICYDLVDVVSTNLYPGWYGNNCDEQHPLAKIHPRLTEL